jgi:hypothetical protein
MHKVDERGKYFTEKVSTQHIAVLVLTTKGEVRGKAHLPAGTRIKDLLNGQDQFVAVTDATMTGYDPGTSHIRFIAINKIHIISVIPLEDDEKDTGQFYEGGY